MANPMTGNPILNNYGAFSMVDGSQVPFMYDFINSKWGMVSPGTVHAKNSQLSYMFTRLLFERAMSVFKWKLPEEFNAYYFYYTFYTFGYIGLLNYKKYGKLARLPAFSEYDIWYYPKTLIFSGAGFDEPLELERNVKGGSVLLNLKGNFHGFYNECSFFGDQLALLFEDAGVSAVNTKLAKVFVAQNKNASESFKTMFDNISSGEPAVFIDRNLMDDEGNPKWLTFDNDVAKNYIIDRLLIDAVKLIKMFDSFVGISSVNTEKKERLIEAEASGNEEESKSAVSMWLENLQRDCENAKKYLDIDIWVELRNKQEGGNTNESETGFIDSGNTEMV